MTRYSEEASDAAGEAAAASRHLTDRAIATAVFDSLTRAPWWEEVEDGYEFQPDEPYRAESDLGASERASLGRYLIHNSPRDRATYFRDTRWQPPVKPLEIGDLIETVEQAASLPVGTIAVTEGNMAFRKAGAGEWRRVDKERGLLLADFKMAGDDDRIIYLPSEVSA